VSFSSFPPGTILAHKYRIERVLGEGAMGVVLLARHLQLDELVAIKMPLSAALQSPDAINRFVREARAAVKIKSEYVARVSDVGTLDSGEPFIVMEYLQGQDLATLLKQQGALPVEQAVEFVLQACEALAEAHALGIVHRDLKPANLFCVRRADGVLAVKVLDFGISKASSAGFDGTLTRTGTVMGSPLYMSPEQLVSARDVDARSDIWSLGIILFQLLCGRAPFNGETLPALSMAIAHAAPVSLCSLRPELPASLERVVLKCLEKDREQRYRDVGELAKALLDFAPKRAAASVERILRVVALAASPETAATASAHEAEFSATQTQDTLSNFGQSGVASTSRLPRAALAFVASLLSVAASAWLWFRSPSRSMPAPHNPVASAAAATGSSLVTNVGAAIVEPKAPPTPTASTPPVHEPAQPAPSIASSARATKQLLPRPPRAPRNTPSNCSPNFYLDDLGEKHFKPECFGAPGDR
jgi:serine/threonine-protein kinase